MMNDEGRMDNDDQQDIRRVGRKDRKDDLKPSRPLFDDLDDSDDADDDTVDKTGADTPREDAIGDPSGLDDIDVPSMSVAAVIARSHNPPEVTPPAERYPPLNVPPEKPPKAQRPVRQISERRRRRGGDRRHGLVALFFFIATILVCGYYAIIWNDPYSSLNFLPPETPFIVITETPDPTAVAVFNATQTEVNRPTETPIPSPTPITPTPTPTLDTSNPPFALSGDVIYAPNENGEECDWLSIAGTVTGLNGEAMNNYGIQITDAEDPERLDERVFSGAALTFGEGGFELNLGNAPRLAQYEVRLYSPAGVPVSDVGFVITSDQCDQNVAIITFVQTRPM